MYEDFFKLSCRPFDLASDPKFIYMTEQHARAVANVRFALMNHDSFVIITGEIGIGKTTILNTVIEELGPDYVTAKLVHTTLSILSCCRRFCLSLACQTTGKRRSCCWTPCGPTSWNRTGTESTLSSSSTRPRT